MSRFPSPAIPPSRAQLSAAGQKVLAKCLGCLHLTSELPGEIPTLHCSAPAWHCHKTGQRAKLRQLLREIVELESIKEGGKE